MKILLRKHLDKYYVWKDAEWENGEYYISVNDVKTRVTQVNILAVADDNRADYVVCAQCGATIPNNPESIEAHFAEREAKRNCFECDQMSAYGDQKNLKIKYTKNEDGTTYHAEEVYDTLLGCGFNSWQYKRIDTEEAKNGCQYFQCRKKGVHQVQDTFVQYPGIFNKQITLDLLIKKGFTNKCPYVHDKVWSIDLGMRGNTLHAFVNELGIVDCFSIHHRYSRYTAFYSEKYDKLFFNVGGKYSDQKPEDMSQAKYNSAKKIIAALYKEA